MPEVRFANILDKVKKYSKGKIYMVKSERDGYCFLESTLVAYSEEEYKARVTMLRSAPIRSVPSKRCKMFGKIRNKKI